MQRQEKEEKAGESEKLSILYLRCGAPSGAVASMDDVTFNSLFEMRRS